MSNVSRLKLPHPGGTTDIWIGEGALKEARSAFGEWLADRRVFIVSTREIKSLHGGELTELTEKASEAIEFDVPDGETSKVLGTAAGLWQDMLRLGGKRDSRLVTLGGGSVCDLGGFVAGCFLRGIEYAHVPTTLLAQVDASIGGKTGVNLPEGKNSVGLFHHPKFVVADADLLETLPPEEIRQALFEVVKAAILGDSSLFELLEQEVDDLLAGNIRRLSEAARRAAKVKIDIVAEDLRENDRRRLLNLGHTLGHALETASGHGSLRHGDAVGHGILFALDLALERGLAPQSADRIRELVKRLQPSAIAGLDPKSVLAAMSRDKKARESGLVWVLPTGIGKARIVSDVPFEDVESHLAPFLSAPVE